MKHLIMGAAGHVDHGKTALIKALTGIDCDTHREEKQRGITINLGFAHLSLPGGDAVGIVDVPGHKNFVNTMISGASGIDFVLMVIAADSGIMPQTLEHFQIMRALGIRAGLIALTKTDLVDEETFQLAREETRELVRGSFLEDAPIVGVSSRTMQGIDTLTACIQTVADQITQRPSRDAFRLFIDRIFTAQGFGTVVTGSVIGGGVHVGDTVHLLPPDLQLRVRRMERHGREVEEICAGDRASLNLVGLRKEDFSRGMLLADRQLRATELLDARLELFVNSRTFGLWTQGVFLLGTFEAQARIHLIDRDKLPGGQTAIVQIHLPEPVTAMPGDHFILRSSSSDQTLGGGRIIDAAPLHHRRRPPELVERLRTIAHGSLSELIAADVRKRFTPVSLRRIADNLNVPVEDVARALRDRLPESIRSLDANGRQFFIVKQQYDRMLDRVIKELRFYHKNNPLDPHGRTAEELIGKLTDPSDPDSAEFVVALLESMIREQTIKRAGKSYALADHDVAPDAEMSRKIELVDRFLRESGLRLPLTADLKRQADRAGIAERTLEQILRYEVAAGRAYYHDGVFVHASHVDRVRTQLIEALLRRPEGLTVAAFRDLIDANRKFCLWAYGLFDSEGITERSGDVRVLTETGRSRGARS